MNDGNNNDNNGKIYNRCFFFRLLSNLRLLVGVLIVVFHTILSFSCWDSSPRCTTSHLALTSLTALMGMRCTHATLRRAYLSPCLGNQTREALSLILYDCVVWCCFSIAYFERNKQTCSNVSTSKRYLAFLIFFS